MTGNREEKDVKTYVYHSDVVQLQNGRYSIGISSGRRTKYKNKNYSILNEMFF
jgi:hypothetical protein